MIYKTKVGCESNKSFLSEDFIDGSIAFSEGSDEAADGEDVGLSKVDGSIFVKVADINLD